MGSFSFFSFLFERRTADAKRVKPLENKMDPNNPAVARLCLMLVEQNFGPVAHVRRRDWARRPAAACRC